MKTIIYTFTLFLSVFSGVGFAQLTDAEISSAFKSLGWVPVSMQEKKIFFQDATPDGVLYWEKAIRPKGWSGEQKLVAVILKGKKKLWVGGEPGRLYVDAQGRVRSIRFSRTYHKRVTVGGVDYSLDKFSDAAILEAFLLELRKSFTINPFVWTTTCHMKQAFKENALGKANSYKLETITGQIGDLKLSFSSGTGNTEVVAVSFDHSDDACMSEEDLRDARGNEQAYPGGYFAWKRGQPEGAFDFQFDEKLAVRLSKILEPKG